MKRVPLFLMCCLILSGCTTYMTQSRNLSKEKRPYSNLLVLGYFENTIARGLVEREVTRGLRQKGLSATPSGNSGIDFGIGRKLSDAEKEGIRQQIIQKGYDGVIVTTRLETAEYRKEIPAYISSNDLPGQYNSFSSYFGFYPALSWEPGRVVTGTYYVLESSLYSLDQEPGSNLQWVGRFEVDDPEDVEKSASRYAKELVGALMATNIRKP